MIASRVIAHRGSALLAPENTVGAMRLTRELGVDWVEIDVQSLGDGTLVVFHDEHLGRLTNGLGPLRALTRQDLAGLDAGSHFSADFAGEPIPLLEDMLQYLAQAGMGLNLELKFYDDADIQDAVEKVVRALETQWSDFGRLLISSFWTRALELMSNLRPTWQYGQLCVELPQGWQSRVGHLPLVSIHCHGDSLTARQAADIKAAGYELYVYTVNDRAAGERLFEMGVDGVITDDPTLFSSHFQGAGRTRYGGSE
ncbi:MAG: glycerophosphoryl diester phosphodiesterase [Natronospirillum sp.]|uniref:glycerophosphodiester phosphodiesterase family protein n=1 Tax=Natronospirillum sp. TaxID=2812955 RepID=UPI0025D94F11|nr:glycerophosphodiester phosphodiesterase family protein [Natronospirillum sp.]MCH8550294.1 glycerophosphoryl diester phosphodiesterase [Natronospirillum sp.]